MKNMIIVDYMNSTHVQKTTLKKKYGKCIKMSSSNNIYKFLSIGIMKFLLNNNNLKQNV